MCLGEFAKDEALRTRAGRVGASAAARRSLAGGDPWRMRNLTWYSMSFKM